MRGNALTIPPPTGQLRRGDAADLVRRYYQSQRRLRKGLCLLNAGVFEAAVLELADASRINPSSADLSTQLVSALAGAGRFADASEIAADYSTRRPTDIEGIIRLALTQWKANATTDAVSTLRSAVADNIDNAELHFQLGTMLMALDQDDEAHLRFVQAVAIDKQHADALNALGLSFAARGDINEALRHLQRAQRCRPHDANIAMMLARAAKAARDAGIDVTLSVDMPDSEQIATAGAIEHLGKLIERDPDFIDACLGLDPAEVDDTAFELFAKTLHHAIERNPHRAALRVQRSRVLERLGRCDEAIAEAEHALSIDPRYVNALILLAELYRQTDRFADARHRLEEAVLKGAEYADLYYLLGNLYRDDGELRRARWAYEKALRINGGFVAAKEALAALAA
ncbi:MAG: tetratricopeptide repeat protein [Phycisphaerales bacterium]|nr:tetratricopeptide repeat protein [Phycisphaerales bacterium]